MNSKFHLTHNLLTQYDLSLFSQRQSWYTMQLGNWKKTQTTIIINSSSTPPHPPVGVDSTTSQNTTEMNCILFLQFHFPAASIAYMNFELLKGHLDQLHMQNVDVKMWHNK